MENSITLIVRILYYVEYSTSKQYSRLVCSKYIINPTDVVLTNNAKGYIGFSAIHYMLSLNGTGNRSHVLILDHLI